MQTMARIPVAQYLRMSTENQQYSLQNQAAAIGEYAARNNYEVIQSYVDAGKSGLVLRHREGLTQLLRDVVAAAQPYKAILVYDISRWGRFQDTDEAAHYEFLCKRAGIPVLYCAETFVNDGSMPSSVMKALKRVMAGEYSRELSSKVFEGQKRMVERGFCVGSKAGYGLRRMLVGPDGHCKQILEDGERKNIRSDRTKLVLGPAIELACIREIYRMFIHDKRSARGIARDLNRKKRNRLGNNWNTLSVLKVLTHEKYTGSMVWGRRSQKLSTRSVPVPRQQWARAPGAFPAIINKQTFEAAQKRLRDRTINKSDERLLCEIRSLLAKKGKLSQQIINQSRLVPSANTCVSRFSSLRRMYELLGYSNTETVLMRKKTRLQVKRLRKSVVVRLKTLFGEFVSVIQKRRNARPKLRLRSGIAVSIVICRTERTVLGDMRWIFESRSAKKENIALVCLCNASNSGFSTFYLLPNLNGFNRCSRLKRNDIRLAGGEQLKGLRQFRKAVQSFEESRGTVL